MKEIRILPSDPRFEELNRLNDLEMIFANAGLIELEEWMWQYLGKERKRLTEKHYGTQTEEV